MNVTQSLDFYCERLGTGFWAEPLNALSNLAFLIAAYLLLRRGMPRWAALVALVGIGSAAFHTFATVWAHWLDLIFIEVFIYCFIALYLRRVFALSAAKIILSLLGYAVFEWFLTGAFVPGALNGSYRYLPALILMLAMTALLPRYAPAMTRPLGLAASIFVIAIIFRTLDTSLCALWPWGTHFIWHMLNAAVLYFSVIALHRRSL